MCTVIKNVPAGDQSCHLESLSRKWEGSFISLRASPLLPPVAGFSVPDTLSLLLKELIRCWVLRMMALSSLSHQRDPSSFLSPIVIYQLPSIPAVAAVVAYQLSTVTSIDPVFHVLLFIQLKLLLTIRLIVLHKLNTRHRGDCRGYTMTSEWVDKMQPASLNHGFQPRSGPDDELVSRAMINWSVVKVP